MQDSDFSTTRTGAHGEPSSPSPEGGRPTAIPPIERTWWIARQIVPHEPMLRGWLHAHAASDAEADDVIHETYAALAALPSVEGVVAPPAYALAVAQAILRRLRADKATTPKAAGVEAQPAPWAGPPHLEDEARVRLAGATARLPAPCRETVRLRAEDGLSLPEIARRRRVTAQEAEAQMAEALQLLMAGLRAPRASR